MVDAEPDDVASFAAHLDADGLSPASATRMLVMVRNLHRFLAAEGVTRTDPAVGLETPAVPSGLPKALSEVEVVAILDAVGSVADSRRRRRIADHGDPGPCAPGDPLRDRCPGVRSVRAGLR